MPSLGTDNATNEVLAERCDEYTRVVEPRVCVKFVREVEVPLFLTYNLAAAKQPD